MNGVPCLQWRGWVNKGSVPPLDSPVTAGRIKIQNYPGSTGVVSHRIRLSKAELLGISWVIYPTQRTVSDPYNWYILSIYVYKILSPFILKYRKLRFDVRTIFREYGEPVPWIMRTGTPWDRPVYRADVYVNNSHVHWLPRRDDRNSSHVEWISPAHFTFAFTPLLDIHSDICILTREGRIHGAIDGYTKHCGCYLKRMYRSRMMWQ